MHKLIIYCLLYTAIFTSCVKTNTSKNDVLKSDTQKSSGKVYERIISTAPSNTEIITALGLAKKLIAVDRYSHDIPGLPPDITYIDFLNPDAETLIVLAPDLIVANAINKQGSGSESLAAIEKLGIQVVYIPVSDSLEGVIADVLLIADLLNAGERGAAVGGEMRRVIEKVRTAAAGIPHKRTVYFEVEPAPHAVSFGSGLFLDEMIQIAGGINIFSGQTGFFVVNAEEVIKANPDVILTNAAELADPAAELYSRAGFENINAHKNKRIYFINTNNSVRASPNIVKGLQEIA
ncbi:MAG: ABC transporter substrate-binding protein, partial [Spirochaetaceae bacterium]|nr:ABC transporter substrate-binding protein [Spirochaetaceae bacterium]